MEAENIEPVRAVIRCRPLISREVQDQRGSIIKVNENLGELLVTDPNESNTYDPKTFSFDHVLGPETSQTTIYNEIAFPLVDSVLRGYNGTIFAYGQTGAGKTYTMQGHVHCNSEELNGIIPRSIEQIFNFIENTPAKQFHVRVSFLEIYNERVNDLLDGDQKGPLKIREHPSLGIYVQDLLSLPVENVTDAYQKLRLGNQNRAIQQTRMGMASSRSHTIFSITVESSEAGSHGKAHIKRGKLSLVDLAGSERLQKTGVTGLMLRESLNINKSISSLRNIISALTDPRAPHVPYRDSQLTRLLQDSLGGNAKTVMIGNIGPADWNYDETISTLRTADRAKSIMNKPMINEEWRDTQEKIEESKVQSDELQGEVTTLKEEDKCRKQNVEEKKVIGEGEKGFLDEGKAEISKDSGKSESGS